MNKFGISIFPWLPILFFFLFTGCWVSILLNPAVLLVYFGICIIIACAVSFGAGKFLTKVGIGICSGIVAVMIPIFFTAFFSCTTQTFTYQYSKKPLYERANDFEKKHFAPYAAPLYLGFGLLGFVWGYRREVKE